MISRELYWARKGPTVWLLGCNLGQRWGASKTADHGDLGPLGLHARWWCTPLPHGVTIQPAPWSIRSNLLRPDKRVLMQLAAVCQAKCTWSNWSNWSNQVNLVDLVEQPANPHKLIRPRSRQGQPWCTGAQKRGSRTFQTRSGAS